MDEGWKPTDREIKCFISAACHDGKCEECKGIYERDKHRTTGFFALTNAIRRESRKLNFSILDPSPDQSARGNFSADDADYKAAHPPAKRYE